MDFYHAYILPLMPLIITFLLPIILSYVTRGLLLAYSRLPAQVREVLKDIVTTGVAAVEMRFPNLSDAEKKKAAEDFIIAQLKLHNLDVPLSVIDPLIEEAVLALHIAEGKVPAA